MSILAIEILIITKKIKFVISVFQNSYRYLLILRSIWQLFQRLKFETCLVIFLLTWRLYKKRRIVLSGSPWWLKVSLLKLWGTSSLFALLWYDKFWSISLGYFIKHKLLISEVQKMEELEVEIPNEQCVNFECYV